MMYKSHLTVSACVAIPVLSVFNEITVVSLAGVALGSLLPDIDTPKSYIGRRLYPIAYILNKQFEHRGLIHSLIPVVALAILGLLFHSIFLATMALGFLLHLVEDGFSLSGIRWLQPIKKKNYKLPYDWMKYRTGGTKEYIILGIAVLILIFEFSHYRVLRHDLLSNTYNHYRYSQGYRHYNNSIF